VLGVDDDPAICEVLTDLVRYEGDDAEHAWSGIDALARIQQAAFSAVILKVHVPDQNGRVVRLELRERSPVLPLIMLTGMWVCRSTRSILAPMPLSSNPTPRLSC
jgi:DNA-binding response OmpR family regulator